MNSVNRSEMIYRVQREPTMASFWTAADQPASRLYLSPPVCAFSPSFILFLLPRPPPLCPCRAINLSRWCGIQPSAAAGCGTARPGAAKLVGVDRWSRCHHRPGYVKANLRGSPWAISRHASPLLRKTGVRVDRRVQAHVELLRLFSEFDHYITI